MGLLDALLSTAKKAEIGYGIHEPVVVMSVSNKVKKSKEGVAFKRNNYTVFGKLNKDGVVVAEKEISWFNIDPASEYAYNNFFTQLDQMVGILDCYYDKGGKKDVVAKAINAVFEEEEIESKEDLEEAIKDKVACKAIMSGISDAYVELMKDNVGVESQTLRLKLSFDSKGKYLQQPKFDAFTESTQVEAAESGLKMSATDAEYEAVSRNAGGSPATGKAPSINI